MKLIITAMLIVFALAYADEAGLGLVTGMKGNTLTCYGNLKVDFPGTRLVFVGPNNMEISSASLRFPFTATVIEPPPTVRNYGAATFIKILEYYEMKDVRTAERE